MEELIGNIFGMLCGLFIILVLWLMARDMKRQEEEDQTRDNRPHQCEWCGSWQPCTRFDCPLVH